MHNFKINASDPELKYLAESVFLPPKLPQQEDPDSRINDAAMIGVVFQVLEPFVQSLHRGPGGISHAAKKGWKIASQMMHYMSTIHTTTDISDSKLKNTLQKMDIDDVLPVYVSHQNAGIIFRKKPYKLFSFESFELSLPNSIVTTTAGKVVVTYPPNPRLTFAGDNKMLDTLANIISFLDSTQIDDTMRVARKAGTNHEDVRDTVSPRYVTEFLFGFIRAMEPINQTADTIYITKRIDDHILWEDAFKPWRRSPMWLLIRVALQSTLQEHGVDGAEGYKAFQAFFMAHVLHRVVRGERSSGVFTDDILHTMNAKLGRRLYKLRALVDENVYPSLQIATKLVFDIASTLEKRWDLYRHSGIERPRWQAPSRDSIRAGTRLTLQKNQKYLRSVVERTEVLAKSNNQYDDDATKENLISQCSTRLPADQASLPSSIQTEELGLSLHDFEVWVEYQLPTWTVHPDRSLDDCPSLAAILKNYHSRAQKEYKKSPEHISLMWLTLLDLWVSLDRIVTRAEPLFNNFHPELIPEVFDSLLLPLRSQMNRLLSIQNYLHGRHGNGTKMSIFGDPNHPYSFANMYFNDSEDLQKKKEEIEEWWEEEEREKMEELKSLNAKYRDLMERHDRIRCDYHTYYDEGYRRTSHSSRCTKCSLWSQATGLKIERFEEPLPRDTEEANAIVYELYLPPAHRIWRDITYHLVTNTLPSEPKETIKLYTFKNYKPLDQFFQERNQQVSFASRTAPYYSTYLGRPHLIPARRSDVILRHAGRLILFDNSTVQPLQNTAQPGSLQSSCAFHLDPPFESLQSFVTSTSHTSNEVIAAQSRCPHDLPLCEFVTFGHVRSGHHLQWRNIMRSLITDSLSLSSPAVLSLILQSAWQAGPNNEMTLHRDAHHDLSDPAFSEEMINTLQNTLDQLGENETKGIALAAVAFLTSRLLSMTDNKKIKEAARKLLESIRSMVLQWIKKIIKDRDYSPNRDVARHQQLIYQLALVGRSTFDLEEYELRKILKLHESASTFQYLTMLAAANSSPSEVHTNATRALIFRDRRLSHRISKHLQDVLYRSSHILDVVEKIWHGFKPGTAWQPLSCPGERWWHCQTAGDKDRRVCTVIVDTLVGTLLVDGKMEGRLPASFSSHPSYKEIFGTSSPMPSLPSSMHGMEYECHYQEFQLHFAMVQENLVIRLSRDGCIEEYISPEKLSGDIPNSLLHRRSHWYIESANTRQIEFRPASTLWTRSTGLTLYLDTEMNEETLSGRLEKVLLSSRHQLVLDPHCAAYKYLYSVLKVLEPSPMGIQVLVDADDEDDEDNADDAVFEVFVHLPRHNLEIFLNQEGQLELRSFPGYIVDVDQEIGCLYRLVEYLCLRDNVTKGSRKIIVPKGHLHIDGLYPHGLTRIKVSVGGGFYSFEVDTLIGRLIGNRTLESDIFLILLHAYTSNPIPDPLTGRTGTEEALDRLSNASMLSFQVFPDDWRANLENISDISPRRCFYPKWNDYMESVLWDDRLPITSQHPEFEPMVEGIFKYWRGVGIGQNQSKFSPRELRPGMSELTLRASLRDRSLGSTNSLRGQAFLNDTKYRCSATMGIDESREREHAAYQFAYCVGRPAIAPEPCRDLRSTIKGWKYVKCNQSWGWRDIPLWFAAPPADAWCTLYELCREARAASNAKDVALAFSLLGYCGQFPTQILATLLLVFSCVEFRDTRFQHTIEANLNLEHGSLFNREKVQDLLEQQEIGFEASPESNLGYVPGRTYEEQRDIKVSEYSSKVDTEVNQALLQIQETWPNIPNRIMVSKTRRLKNLDTCISTRIQPLLLSCSRNYYFLKHLDDVVTELRRVHRLSPLPSTYRFEPTESEPRKAPLEGINIPLLLKSCSYPIDRSPSPLCLDPILIPNEAPSQQNLSLKLKHICQDMSSPQLGTGIEAKYLAGFEASITAFRDTPPPRTMMMPVSFLCSYLEHTTYDCSRFFDRIQYVLAAQQTSGRLLTGVGLWPRLSRKILLRCLSLKERKQVEDDWKSGIFSFAQRIAHAQRARRLLRHAVLGQEAEYTREVLEGRDIESLGDLDWILVELDSDFRIRNTQVEIANAMIAPERSANSVIQLNMGEGKSSVITPIVAASLANTHQLVRVVVLKSQSKMVLKLLRQRLCDLVNRRILYIPFNRNTPVGNLPQGTIQQVLQDCLDNGGVWLCQPEHLLSFKLLGLEVSMTKNATLGRELVKSQLWIEDNTRDMLDESDEILHPRRQLVYTLGTQRSFDAAPERWELVQKILSLLKDCVISGHDPNFLVTVPGSPTKYPTIRATSDNAQRILVSLGQRIIDEGLVPSVRLTNAPASVKECARAFITSLNPLPPVSSVIYNYCRTSRSVISLWKNLLLLRGLIAHEILFMCLKNKRYRVDYGLDLGRSQLAVPYLAKDSPSLRSEFAHPDVIIVLTCLSYYYHGLTDKMILQAVNFLMKSDASSTTYEKWISPCRDVPDSLKSLSGIPMDDESALIATVGRFLRHNRDVIDFYLNMCVFPKSAKEFPYKMSTSGWDLAMQKSHPTTGFSGTNDSRYLLPTTIRQIDSPDRLHTNATVLSHLLRPENRLVVEYTDNIASGDLINRVMAQDPRPSVILDVGAQVLDKDNHAFASAWLSRYDSNSETKAAVYFDNDDNMCIVTHDGIVQLFHDSPFSTRLEHCLVYLDDAHTRGTDLKLPRCKAAVTLGPRLGKDKLVQGCMRMRKLGTIHSIVFLAPLEVIKSIKSHVQHQDRDLTSHDVIIWAMKETCRQLKTDAAIWAVQGHEFVRRTKCWTAIREETASGRAISIDTIKNGICQDDSRSLEELYGVDERFGAAGWLTEYHTPNAQSDISKEIFKHSELFGSLSLREAGMRQEQEIELVNEKEEERQIQRPPPAKAAKHYLHPDVRRFVETGQLFAGPPGFSTITDFLEDTSLELPKGISSVLSNVILTKDFCKTIKPDSNMAIDEFMRQVEWLASHNRDNSHTLVALSPFEANELFPVFKGSIHAKLHLFAARSSRRMKTLEDLTCFTLPSHQAPIPQSRAVAQQLNLFSGSLYLRDYQSYVDLCNALGLYYRPITNEVDRCEVDPSGFVKDKAVRSRLGFIDPTFKENPLVFLHDFFVLRRYGRSLGPSHLGQITCGIELKEADFPDS